MFAHRAYSFDPRKFHMEVETRVIRDQELRLDLLHGWAVEITSHPSDITREVLHYARYDEEDWLENDSSNSDVWYLIALASVVLPVPHLRIPSVNTIEKVLLVAGWSTEQARQLLYGRDLRKLPELYGHRALHHKFRTLNQYGGWLDLPDAQRLLAKLSAVERYFSPAAPESLEALREYAGYWGLDPVVFLQPAYEDAHDMLQAATEKQQALYLWLFD